MRQRLVIYTFAKILYVFSAKLLFFKLTMTNLSHTSTKNKHC